MTRPEYRRDGSTVRPIRPELQRHVDTVEALAHLLACLDAAVRALDDVGQDVDARIVEAHRAALARGQEWPGDPVTPPDLP